MNEYEKGNFKCDINLPRQEIYFKFIVDDKWVFSNNYDKKDDGHYNINNYIDLTNYKIEEKKVYRFFVLIFKNAFLALSYNPSF